VIMISLSDGHLAVDSWVLNIEKVRQQHTQRTNLGTDLAVFLRIEGHFKRPF
jgi:hypothetical protein